MDDNGIQKFVNDREKMVDESIVGFVKCYRNLVSYTDCPRALKRKEAPIAGKVGIVSGGGWGHDPAFMGYLGENMLDAVAIGDTFTPPSAQAFLAAFRAADSGSGVVCIYGNYPKDIENANIAIAQATREGIIVDSVIANDDVASLDPATRRGMTGEVLAWKTAAAAAAQNYDRLDVVRIAQKTVDNTRSIGVGLASCMIPETGRPNYIIEQGTMEIGVSHHGLWSKDTCKLRSADAIADIMLSEILKDLPLSEKQHVAVMISGLGNTMQGELNILYSRIFDTLTSKGVEIDKALIGNYFTSLDMMGATLSVMKLDDELTALLAYPSRAVALSHFNN